MTDEPTSGAFRLDALTGDWRVISPGRRGVPAAATRLPELPDPPGPCPFCPDNLALQGETVCLVGDDWPVRVVRNRYPTVQESALHTPGSVEDGDASDAADRFVPAGGAHEVLIEGPEHLGDIPTFDPAHFAVVWQTYLARARALAAVPGVQHVAIFRNRGRRAGSSQPHPHGQIVATRALGPGVSRRWARAAQHHAQGGGTLLADVLEADRAADRVVREEAPFVWSVPYAPQLAFESRVLPASGAGNLLALPPGEVAVLAALVQRAVARTVEVSGRPAYNLVLRLPPVAALDHGAAFWSIDILPRGGPGAGLELSTGFTMVSTPPEEAVTRLRQ